MENIKDIIDWIIYGLLVIVGYFLRDSHKRIEATLEKHDTRIKAVETEVAVIGKSVDNNFATLSASIDNLQSQLSDIKDLLIDQIKENKK